MFINNVLINTSVWILFLTKQPFVFFLLEENSKRVTCKINIIIITYCFGSSGKLAHVVNRSCDDTQRAWETIRAVLKKTKPRQESQNGTIHISFIFSIFTHRLWRRRKLMYLMKMTSTLRVSSACRVWIREDYWYDKMPWGGESW